MKQIIIGQHVGLDCHAAVKNIKVLETPEQMNGFDAHTVFVLPDTPDILHYSFERDCKLYVPFNRLDEGLSDRENVYVYFDLNGYPFFQKIREFITKENKPKGVFRFRRVLQSEVDESLMTGDLYVISTILGDSKNVHIKRSRKSVHVILSIDFGGGTMAHMEYTQSDHEKMEVEWSGINKIIEFDSNETTPLHPGNRTDLPLCMNPDLLLYSAHKGNRALLQKTGDIKKMISGGAHQ